MGRQGVSSALLLVGSCVMAACGHTSVAGNLSCSAANEVMINGGCEVPPPPAPPPPASPPPPAGLQPNTAFSTTPAARPTAGANTTAPVLASAQSVGSLPLGAALPLTQTAVLLASNTIAPDISTNSGGATLVYGEDGNPNDFTLHIPSLAATVTAPISPQLNTLFSSSNILLDKNTNCCATFGYSSPGLWIAAGTSSTTVSAFMTGLETPANAIPNFGSAVFFGLGFSTIFNPKLVGSVANPTGVSLLDAYVTMNANFGSGVITGNVDLSDTLATNNQNPASNGVAFCAQIASGSNSFSGTASAASPPSGANGSSLNSNATGTIDGKFYGPNAQEVGAVWTLSDGAGSEIGSFAAKSVTIGVPAPASYGSNPLEAQIAAVDGPALDGSGAALPATVSFPLLTTSLQITPDGVSALAGQQSATATLDSGAGTLHVVLPSANFDRTFALSAGPTSNRLSAVAIGDWTQSPMGTTLPYSTETIGLFGFETPASAMPTSGTANYSGQGTVQGTVYIPSGVYGPAPGALKGDANLSVEFASGNVSGKFTNMTAWDYCLPPVPWNDVTVNAKISAGTNKFSGTTGTPSSVNSPAYGLKSTATGSISGGFYAPSAQQLGAVWSLSDGTTSAIGGVVAGH